MTSSLGRCRAYDTLGEMIHNTDPDFSCAPKISGGEDLGEAPEEIGRMYARRELLKKQNNRGIITAAHRETNLLWLDVLDKLIRIAVRDCAPKGMDAALVQVNSYGRIIRRKR